MKNEPLISIGIPTYNRAYLLDLFFQKLLSVVKIFPGKIEILISDNFSTDDTKQVCDRWLRSFDCYGPVAYTKNDSNIGVARNIISLIEQAKGNYFLFIGDDDCLFENGLRRIIEVLESDNPPSAIIQGQGWGANRSIRSGYVPYTFAANLFYEYGNAWAGIISRKAAVDVLQNSGLRNEIEQIVWPQTVIGFLAMHSLKDQPIYITDFPIGGSIDGGKNVTNKSYWVTSLYGLLRAAQLVDNAIGVNWVRNAFVGLKTRAFVVNIYTILFFSCIAENTSSNIVQDQLRSYFGVAGKFWAFILFVGDNYPKVVEYAGVLLYSIRHFKAPSYAIRRINDERSAYLENVRLSTVEKRMRYGDWF